MLVNFDSAPLPSLFNETFWIHDALSRQHPLGGFRVEREEGLSTDHLNGIAEAFAVDPLGFEDNHPSENVVSGIVLPPL